MSQLTNTPPPVSTPANTAPMGISTPQGDGQPGAGNPPSDPPASDADTGLLFSAGQTAPQPGPEGQGDGQSAGGEEPPKPEGAPETYELKTRDGFAWDDATSAAVTPLFKELGLNNAQAQKLADYHMEAMATFQRSQVEQFHKMQAAEAEAAKADPEVGGSRLAESLSLAAKAMDTYGGQEFRDALQSHGMANNLSMLRFLAKIGRELTGDRFVAGTRPQQEESAAKVLYPDWN